MGTPTRSVKGDPGPLINVFRVITNQAERDREVRRIFGGRLRSWKGEAADKAPMVAAEDGPVLRLTPKPYGWDWYDPTSQGGWLTVLFELSVQSLCIDDVYVAWNAVVTALSPADEDFRAALVAAGAETGEAVFSDPFYDPQPAAEPSGVFNAAGALRLKVIAANPVEIP